MATENPIQVLSFKAAADLSAAQFKAVKVDSNGEIALCGDGDSFIGILQNDPTSGNAGDVMTYGKSKAIASAAIAAGALVTTAALGKVKTADGEDKIFGVATIAAAADGDIISVLLLTGGATAVPSVAPVYASMAAGAEGANIIKITGQVKTLGDDEDVAGVKVWRATTYDAGATITDGGTGSLTSGSTTVEATGLTDAAGNFQIDITDTAAESVVVEVAIDGGISKFITLVFA